jgi:hypothetical protein
LGELNFNTACPPTPALEIDRDHMIACIDQLLTAVLDVLPGVVIRAEKMPDPFVSVIDTSSHEARQGRARDIPLDFRVVGRND